MGEGRYRREIEEIGGREVEESKSERERGGEFLYVREKRERGGAEIEEREREGEVKERGGSRKR